MRCVCHSGCLLKHGRPYHIGMCALHGCVCVCVSACGDQHCTSYRCLFVVGYIHLPRLTALLLFLLVLLLLLLLVLLLSLL
jgi:hypothetical protein